VFGVCGFSTKLKVKDIGVMLKLIEDNDLKIRVVKNTPSFNYDNFWEHLEVATFTEMKITHFNKKQIGIKKLISRIILIIHFVSLEIVKTTNIHLSFVKTGNTILLLKIILWNLKQMRL